MRDCGASINDAGKQGLTPLLAAARYGNAKLLDEICRYFPVLVNLGDSLGQTAVYYAALHRDQRLAIRMISTLIAKGANINIACERGTTHTALQAARNLQHNVTATYLRQCGAIGQFEESEKCKFVRPNLVLYASDYDSDEETEKIEEEEEEVDENDSKRIKIY